VRGKQRRYLARLRFTVDETVGQQRQVVQRRPSCRHPQGCVLAQHLQVHVLQTRARVGAEPVGQHPPDVLIHSQRFGVDLDGLRRLPLGREMQPERGNVRRERTRVQLPGPRLTPLPQGHSFTLMPRIRPYKAARFAAFGHSGIVLEVGRGHFRKPLSACYSCR